ncbi:golgin candidate 4-like isoform X1 [Tasmannia lanceolata]|uniref:golgin candidate 4-like isoform X1 n=1 Tax=Tasmannia lanceolata TaxID=3420 RepID=UPI004062E0EA
MMRGSIATFKESLSQIVQDAEIYGSLAVAGEDTYLSHRRISHQFAHSKSPFPPNGTDSPYNPHIEQYKAEIQRLQASEAEIKALSVNYAAILKEKEEELSRLHEENGSLRRNLEATSAAGFASRNGSTKRSKNNLSVLKGIGDLSTSRHQRQTTQVNPSHNATVAEQDTTSNGSSQATQSDRIQRKVDLKLTNLQEDEKELADLTEENNRALATMRANHVSELNQLRAQLEKELENVADTKLTLQGEQKLNESSQKELLALKMDKDRISMEMKVVSNELNEKISEIKRLQLELNRRDLEEEPDEPAESLKKVIMTIEKENIALKKEKDELLAALKLREKHTSNETYAADSGPSDKHMNDFSEAHSSETFPGKEEMSASILMLENALKDACLERDKALQELARLKQHLLDKELEESDKMDEDSRIIEELRAKDEYQRAQISHLERTLNQARSSQEEFNKINIDKLQKANEVIDDLKKKLESCMSTVDSKNVELLNFQTALGQYYAETEAKERLGRDLVVAREESAKLSQLSEDANQRLEVSKRENVELLAKLSQAERILSEGKHRAQKLEEDNLKLRRALEQSMTRLNRMSLDSDYFVDRRIVIKLLVTYFQRNHSKEVLDLMVRMLGFSEEDKQRIGCAQQVAGKGVVRGVLGLPGRLVGGIFGGASLEVSAHFPSESQSFADLWVDFLLKETEERERRESAEGAAGQSRVAIEGSPNNARVTSIPEQRRSTSNSSASSTVQQTFHFSMNQISSPLSVRGNQQFEQSDHEFSTVPLTLSISPAHSSQFPKPPTRY